MRLIFHGTLRDLYGESATIKTKVPADAIEGFFSQQPNHPRDMLIDAVDFGTPDLLSAETDVEEIHLLPAMYGGGGKFGSIILGAAMIGLAFATGGASLAGAGLISFSGMGASLVLGGAMMILQGVMNLFMKAPTVSKSEDPPASKYLGQNSNTVASGTPIPIACGRINLSGHWLSLQNDSDKLAFGSFSSAP